MTDQRSSPRVPTGNEDEEFLDPSALNTQKLRHILSKYDVPLPTAAANKSFLVKLYKDNKIDEKIRQRWAEDAVRRTAKRPRTIELADQPQKVRKVRQDSRSPHKPAQGETLQDIVQNYTGTDEAMEVDPPAPVPVAVSSRPVATKGKRRTPRTSPRQPESVQSSPFQKVAVAAPRTSAAPSVPLTTPVQVTNASPRTPSTPTEERTKRLKPQRESRPSAPSTGLVTQPSPRLLAPQLAQAEAPSPQREEPVRRRRRRTSSIRPEMREAAEIVDMEQEGSRITQFASVLLILILVVLGVAGVMYYSNKPELPYCGTGQPEIPGVCVPCPLNGFCEKMSYRCSCPTGYVVSHDRTMCIEDRSIPQMAERMLSEHVRPLLRRIKGEYLCGHSVTAEIPEKELEAHLRLEYSKIAPNDIAFNEFYQILAEMRNMFPIHHIYRTPTSEFVHEAMVGTHEDPLLSVACSLKIFVWRYWPFLLIGTVALVYGTWKFVLYRKKNEAMTQIRYELTRKAEEDEAERGVSVQQLREEICPHSGPFSLNYHVWKAVETAVAYDDQILDTQQRIDGTQKLMWELRL